MKRANRRDVFSSRNSANVLSLYMITQKSLQIIFGFVGLVDFVAVVDFVVFYKPPKIEEGYIYVVKCHCIHYIYIPIKHFF